jgi:hypothetical protein
MIILPYFMKTLKYIIRHHSGNASLEKLELWSPQNNFGELYLLFKEEGIPTLFFEDYFCFQRI